MKITFIGGGNMAQAIIGGLLKKKAVSADDIAVVDPDQDARLKINSLGVKNTLVGLNQLLPPLQGVVILAVKPQSAPAACLSLAELLNEDVVVLSIAAGIRLSTIARSLKGHLRLVRCMPNTPALVSAGITGVYAQSDVDEKQRADIQIILESVGKVVWVTKEDLLDPVTAVSGSGPAYVFYFIEALEQAGIELGLPKATARSLALETFLGAAKLAAGSQDNPATLREKVTSKGGTTERALASLNEERVKEAFMNAVKAANQRAKELGDIMDQV